MKQATFSTYVVGILIIGTTMIPGNMFVDNFNLPRNFFFFFFCCIYTFLFLFFYKKGFQINQESIFTILCLLLCVVRNGKDNQQLGFIIAFSNLLIILNQVKIKQDLLCRILTLCLFVENAFCILQLLKITPSFNHFFKVTGSFENPNTCGLFISLCFPFLFDFYRTRKKSLGLLVGIFSVTSIIVMGCRVSLVCIIFSVLYMCGNNLDTRKKRLVVFSIISAFMLVMCSVKTNSSLGRLLIFMATLKLLTETPINGWGYNGFTHEYMKNQSEILSSRYGEYFLNIEGNPLHPLNEYILYTCNVGICGIIAIACFAYILYKKRRFYNKCMYSCIITIIVQSMFTYSLRYAFTWTFIAILLTQSSRHKGKILSFSFVSPLIMVLSLYCTYVTFKQLQFEVRWKKVWDIATNEGITMQVRNEYDSLYEENLYSTQFLFNYAYVLHESQEYISSNVLLNEYEKDIIDYQCTMLKADNFYEIHDYKSALANYQKAHMMCPTLYIPLWKQLLCYKATGRKCNVIKLAKEILTKNEKIVSYTNEVIKRQCLEILYYEEKE